MGFYKSIKDKIQHTANEVEEHLSSNDQRPKDSQGPTHPLMIYLQNKECAKRWKELEEKSKQKLIEMTTENTTCMQCKISQRTRIGNVDYRQLTTDLNISDDVVSKYRKTASQYWEIRT